LSHYVFALPLILLAGLRGEVGTDTAGYVQDAQSLIWWGSQAFSGFEYGYVLLVRFFALVSDDPRVVVALISLLAAVLFFVMLHMWEGGRCILSLVLIPVCYFDFTMNGLRMGIAFPLAVIATLQLEKKRFILFYLLAAAAISIQMTAALLLLMLFLARWGVKLSAKTVAYGLLIGATVLCPAYYLLGNQIGYKLLSYSIMYSPTSFSGAGPLAMSFCACLLGIWISQKSHRYLGVTFAVIQLAFFGLSSFSYAGLRFQEMALFAQLLALSHWIVRPLRKRQLAAIALLCCVACGWTARNFIMTSGEVSSFIPYHFVWESQ
jgi:uncharacterized membrane-anchored protein YitT (DUF2179 family)